MNNEELRTELTEYDLESLYDDMLDECYDMITICGLDYSPSRALSRVDETAYSCGFNDWLDSMVKDGNIEFDSTNDKYYGE